jgi:hypothetical protein
MVKHLSPEKRAGGTSNLMTDGEFEDFWLYLDNHRHEFYAQEGFKHERLSSILKPVPPPRHLDVDHADGSSYGRGRPHKSHHRCGTCRGCTSSDCGQCKNCRDKPRFGGPGIKKKACLRRLCLKARDRDFGSDDDDEQEAISPQPTPPHVPGATSFYPQHPVKGPSETQSEADTVSPQITPTMRPSSPEEIPVQQHPTGGHDLVLPASYEERHAPLHHQEPATLDALSRMAAATMAH